MRSVPAMTAESLGEVLASYARGLVVLQRRCRELRHARAAALLEQAVNALDEIQGGLRAPAAEPDDDPLEFVTFALGRDARETVALAITRSAELAAPGTSRSAHLSLICLDFLATNDLRFADEMQRLRFLAKFEVLTGLKFILASSDGSEVVYGIDALEKLARGYATGDGGKSA